MSKQTSLRGLVVASTSAIALSGAITVALAATPSVDSGDQDDGKGKKLAATRSSPIAITSDDRFVWSVNPDNDSVSVFNVAGDANKKVAEIQVGKEPWCVAIKSEEEDDDNDHDQGGRNDDDDAKVYVTNMVSGTVSVIDAEKWKVIKTIKVGTEPFGCALSPDGSAALRQQPILEHRISHRHATGPRDQDDRKRRSQTARHRGHGRWQEGVCDSVAVTTSRDPMSLVR